MATTKEILQRPYSRVLVPEGDGRFSASILEFPGCFSHGDSAAQAYANLEEAATSWIEAAIDQKIDIPEPLADQRTGRCLLLLLPRGLHQKLMVIAERDGVNLDQYIVATLVGQVRTITAEDPFLRDPLQDTSKSRAVSRRRVDDESLDLEIKTLESEGPLSPRRQRALTWLRELQRHRAAPATADSNDEPLPDNADLDFEIKMMEREGSMSPSMDPRWQRGLAWLRELQRYRTDKQIEKKE